MSRTDIQVQTERGVDIWDAAHLTKKIDYSVETARNFLLASKGLRDTVYAPDDCLVRGLQWVQDAVRLAEIRHSDPRVKATKKSLRLAEEAADVEGAIRAHAEARGLELP